MTSSVSAGLNFKRQTCPFFHFLLCERWCRDGFRVINSPAFDLNDLFLFKKKKKNSAFNWCG